MTARPDYIVATGEYLAEWMREKGVDVAELSHRLGAPPRYVGDLLAGDAPISETVAHALDRVTGVPARIWTLHEAGYRADLARAAGDRE